MGIVLANNAHTTLSADASSTDTTIYVEDIDSFPTLDVGDYFYLTLERTSGAMEIVKVTQINASSFTVVRGQEDTIPISFSIGSMAKLNMTVQNITDLLVTGSNVDDSAYSSDWNGDTDDAPSRNAVYDKFVTVDAALAGYTAADVLAKLLTVDGTGSGLDADLLDGVSSAAFAQLSGATFTGPLVTTYGQFQVGWPKFTGDAILTLAYDDIFGAEGTISWERDGVGMWYIRSSGTNGDWRLRNVTLGTDAISIDDATNNITFTGTVAVPDDAYAAGWNGSALVPTKNAVYDKIETLLPSASYTAADVLSKLLTVDGTGSGLDADTLDGNEAAAFALLSGATFAGTVAVSTGLAKIGTKTFSGAATLELKYNTGGSYNGQVSFLEFDVYKWSLVGRASTGAFALYNHTFLTDAITVTASNNATFSGTVTVPDDAYAAGWDGNLTVPTKNAVYDKIQSLATLSDGDKGDVTVSASGATWTIDNNAVTLAKMATMATDSILGRATAATGNVEVLTALPWAYTGDVTRPADSNALTIANNAVSLAKMATMATDSILGRATAGTGNVEVLTALPFAFTGDVTRPADSNAQTIANDAVTYAKMQNVSAQYKILGRSTAGAGDVEELSTSANMVSLIASADYSTARTNLGLAIGTNVQAYSAILAALAASSNITGTITVSTSAPSGGSSGDVWYERAA